MLEEGSAPRDGSGGVATAADPEALIQELSSLAAKLADLQHQVKINHKTSDEATQLLSAQEQATLMAQAKVDAQARKHQPIHNLPAVTELMHDNTVLKIPEVETFIKRQADDFLKVYKRPLTEKDKLRTEAVSQAPNFMGQILNLQGVHLPSASSDGIPPSVLLCNQAGASVDVTQSDMLTLATRLGIANPAVVPKFLPTMTRTALLMDAASISLEEADLPKARDCVNLARLLMNRQMASVALSMADRTETQMGFSLPGPDGSSRPLEFRMYQSGVATESEYYNNKKAEAARLKEKKDKATKELETHKKFVEQNNLKPKDRDRAPDRRPRESSRDERDESPRREREGRGRDGKGRGRGRGGRGEGRDRHDFYRDDRRDDRRGGGGSGGGGRQGKGRY